MARTWGIGLLLALLLVTVPSAAAADTLNLTLLSQTATTITLGWTPPSGVAGYRFSSERAVKPDGTHTFSYTWDPLRSSVRFAKGSQWYRVEALTVSAEGAYPVAAPTPTTISPGQFEALAAAGATIQRVTVTGPVTISNSNVTVTDSTIQGDVTIPFNTSNITLQDVSLDRVTIGETAFPPGQQPSVAPATNIVLRRVHGTYFVVAYARRVRILDGEWGNVNRAPRVVVSNPWDAPELVPVDVLIENNYIHDITMDTGGEHVEGVLVYAGNGIVVRDNRFVRIGGTGDLSISFLHLDPYNPLIANVLVSGNTGSSEPGGGAYAYFNVQYDGRIPNLTFTGNTFPKGMLNVDFVPSSGIRVAAPPPNWPPPPGG